MCFSEFRYSTRYCHRKEIAAREHWSPGLGMQHFRASICFWTMSLIVKVTSKNQYKVLRGYKNSSADGWLYRAGCTSCWTQPKSSAYGLTCCSSVANCTVKSSSSARLNRMWNMTNLSAVRISAFNCWNVAAVVPSVSAWRSCLLCRAVSLAASRCNYAGVIQQRYCALSGLAWTRSGPAPRHARGSKLLGRMIPWGFCWEAVLNTNLVSEMLLLCFQMSS